LEGIDVEEWRRYIHTLRSSHPIIREDEDELIWEGNIANGIYTPKLGY